MTRTPQGENARMGKKVAMKNNTTTGKGCSGERGHNGKHATTGRDTRLRKDAKVGKDVTVECELIHKKKNK